MASSSRAQGRGSAVAAAAALVTLLVLVHGAVAEDYPVAGTGTWTFGQYQAWADGIKFVEGDTITFTYSPTAHDVVTLNSQADFDSCNVASPKQLYNSGNDKIALVAGTNFFTCQFPSHCPAMKFSAVAAQAASPPTTPAPTTPAPATPPTSPAPTTPAPTTPPTTPAPTTPPTTPTPVSPATPPRTPPPPTTRTPPRAAPAPAPSAAGSVKATLATVFGAAALALVI